MAVTSSSTLAQVWAQYDDNADYEGDLAKARLFCQACRILKRRDPTGSTCSDGRSVQFAGIESELQRVQQYLDMFDATNRPRAAFVQGRCIL